MEATRIHPHDGRTPDRSAAAAPTAGRATSTDGVLLAVVTGSFLPIGLIVAAVFGGGAVIVGLAFVAEVLVTVALVAAIGRAVGPEPAGH